MEYISPELEFIVIFHGLLYYGYIQVLLRLQQTAELEAEHTAGGVQGLL